MKKWDEILEILENTDKVIKSVIGFIAACVFFGIYVLLVTPWVEPPISQVEDSGENYSRNKYHKELSGLLEPDAWELKEMTTTVEMNGFTIICSKHKIRDHYFLDLERCTVIIYPDQNKQEHQYGFRTPKEGQVILVRVPEGATLKFNQPLTFMKDSFGYPVQGILKGPVSIISKTRAGAKNRSEKGLNSRGSGQLENFTLQTRDVKYENGVIHTNQQVRMKYGNSEMLGRSFSARVAMLNESGEKFRILGLDSVELEKLTSLKLYLPVSDLMKNKDNNKKNSGYHQKLNDLLGPEKILPLEVRCDDRVTLDGHSGDLQFRKNVMVMCRYLTGETDTLTCDDLILKFPQLPENLMKDLESSEKSETGEKIPDTDSAVERLPVSTHSEKVAEISASSEKTVKKNKEDGDSVASAEEIALTPKSLPKHAPEQIIAQGERVVLNSHHFHVTAVGTYFFIHIPERTIQVRDPGQAAFRFGENEFHANGLAYTFQEDSQLGMIQADGAGWLKYMNNAKENAVPIRASWRKLFKGTPEPNGEYKVIMSDDTVIENDMGKILADKVEVYLKKEAFSLTQEEKYYPKRICASGEVRVNAVLNDTEVDAAFSACNFWFEPMKSEVFQYLYEQKKSREKSAGHPYEGAPDQSGEPHQDVKRMLKMSAKMLMGTLHFQDNLIHISRLILDENILMEESAANLSTGEPFLLSGEKLDVRDATLNTCQAVLTGAPALLGGRGTQVKAAQINANCGMNQVWINGLGEVSLFLREDAEGKHLEIPQTITIHWGGTMLFNGSSVVFKENVVVNHPLTVVTARVLTANLGEYLSLNMSEQLMNRAAAGHNIQLQSIKAEQDVLVKSRIISEGKQTGVIKVIVPYMEVNMLTRDVMLGGRGEVLASMYEKNKDENKNNSNIIHVHLQFRDSGRVNYITKKTEVTGDILAVSDYVNSWDEDLPLLKDPVTLSSKGVIFKCGKLSIMSPPEVPADMQGLLDFKAENNVKIDMSQYAGTADELSYSRYKDLVIMSGNTAPAHLVHQKNVGGPHQDYSGRQIELRLKNREVQIKDAHTGSL